MTTRCSFFPARRIRPEAGFTMVELLITAFILGIGLLGLAALQTMAVRGYSGSKIRDAGANLASSILDQLAADGRLTAVQRATDPATVSTTALLANAALDTATAYQVRNKAGVVQTQFNLRGGPIEPTSADLDESSPVFTATYVVLTNGKDGDPVGASGQMAREVIVNVTWREAIQQSGATALQDRNLSVSRYVRF